MPTFHAVVWLDHLEAHVLMFDRDHVILERIKSRSHHKYHGKPQDSMGLFSDVAKALHGVHEILLTGPGKARDEFRSWCTKHDSYVTQAIVDSVACDHPTDAQVIAMARKYFKKYDFTTQGATIKTTI